jgi:hypothetical protein
MLCLLPTCMCPSYQCVAALLQRLQPLALQCNCKQRFLGMRSSRHVVVCPYSQAYIIS